MCPDCQFEEGHARTCQHRTAKMWFRITGLIQEIERDSINRKEIVKRLNILIKVLESDY